MSPTGTTKVGFDVETPAVQVVLISKRKLRREPVFGVASRAYPESVNVAEGRFARTDGTGKKEVIVVPDATTKHVRQMHKCILFHTSTRTNCQKNSRVGIRQSLTLAQTKAVNARVCRCINLQSERHSEIIRRVWCVAENRDCC